MERRAHRPGISKGPDLRSPTRRPGLPAGRASTAGPAESPGSPAPPTPRDSTPTSSPSSLPTTDQTISETPATTQPPEGEVTPVPTPSTPTTTIYTTGTPPDTTTISATITDPSGVDTVALFYRADTKPLTKWGFMKPASEDTWTTTFGPFPTAGTYEYRILATDTAGNSTCTTRTLTTCPGGYIEVIIP